MNRLESEPQVDKRERLEKDFLYSHDWTWIACGFTNLHPFFPLALPNPSAHVFPLLQHSDLYLLTSSPVRAVADPKKQYVLSFSCGQRHVMLQLLLMHVACDVRRDRVDVGVNRRPEQILESWTERLLPLQVMPLLKYFVHSYL